MIAPHSLLSATSPYTQKNVVSYTCRTLKCSWRWRCLSQKRKHFQTLLGRAKRVTLKAFIALFFFFFFSDNLDELDEFYNHLEIRNSCYVKLSLECSQELVCVLNLTIYYKGDDNNIHFTLYCTLLHHDRQSQHMTQQDRFYK